MRQGFLHGFRKAEAKDEWLTPPEIVSALGPFDLDPCSPIARPWPTAQRHLTVKDDGMMHDWKGRVWLNPPYGKDAAEWMRRLASHGNGVALVFARTETSWFFDSVWNAKTANAVFFFRGRIAFYHVTGEQGDAAGAPSVLISYGENNTTVIENSGLDGYLVRLIHPVTTASPAEVCGHRLFQSFPECTLPKGHGGFHRHQKRTKTTPGDCE